MVVPMLCLLIRLRLPQESRQVWPKEFEQKNHVTSYKSIGTRWAPSAVINGVTLDTYM